MRDPGELRAIAIHRYTGNWVRDSQGITDEELEEFEHAWHAEAARRYELLERARRMGLRIN